MKQKAASAHNMALGSCCLGYEPNMMMMNMLAFSGESIESCTLSIPLTSLCKKVSLSKE